MGKDISRKDFTVPRTPPALAQFVQEVYGYIESNKLIENQARINQEPYKTFFEEMVPFSHFCTWRHGNNSNVKCALVEGTPGRDATITDVVTRLEHSVEITWPIDGHEFVKQRKQLNDRGYYFKIWGREDISIQQDAVKRLLEIARKKSIRDYHGPGGSSIVFVFDKALFRDNNQRHCDLLQTMINNLSEVRMLVDNIFIMLLLGDESEVIEVKGVASDPKSDEVKK